MRCEEHGLAAGPEGDCVVCLREARGRAERRARRLGAAFCGFLLLACAGLLTTHWLRTPPLAESPLAVAADPSLAVAVAPAAAATRVVEASSAELVPVLPLDPPPVSGPVAAVSAIAPSASASAAPASSARGPNQRELLAALHATPVTMFSTSWCPHCQRARRFFQSYGLNVVDHDVDADARAAAELERRSGGKAVPLIDVDGQELKGFDQQATMAAVVASVERRLGITGVKLSAASVSN